MIVLESDTTVTVFSVLVLVVAVLLGVASAVYGSPQMRWRGASPAGVDGMMRMAALREPPAVAALDDRITPPG